MSLEIPDLGPAFERARLLREICLTAHREKRYTPSQIVDFYLTFGTKPADISHFFARYNPMLEKYLSLLERVAKWDTTVLEEFLDRTFLGAVVEYWSRGLLDEMRLAQVAVASIWVSVSATITAKWQLDLYFVVVRHYHDLRAQLRGAEFVRSLALEGDLKADTRISIYGCDLLELALTWPRAMSVPESLRGYLGEYCYFDGDGMLTGYKWRAVINGDLSSKTIEAMYLSRADKKGIMTTVTQRPTLKGFVFLERVIPDFWRRMLDGSDFSRALFETTYVDYDKFLNLVFKPEPQAVTESRIWLLEKVVKAGIQPASRKHYYKGREPAYASPVATSFLKPSSKVTIRLGSPHGDWDNTLPEGFSYQLWVKPGTPVEAQIEPAHRKDVTIMVDSEMDWPKRLYQGVEDPKWLSKWRYEEVPGTNYKIRRPLKLESVISTACLAKLKNEWICREVPLEPELLEELVSIHGKKRVADLLIPYLYHPDVMRDLWS